MVGIGEEKGERRRGDKRGLSFCNLVFNLFSLIYVIHGPMQWRSHIRLRPHDYKQVT